MLFTVIAAVAAPTPAISCPVAHISWACEAAWIVELPERQQTVMLVILRKHANEAVAEWVAANSHASKADKCRMAAFGGFVQGVLLEAATNSPALRDYLSYEVEQMTRLASGDINADEFTKQLSGRKFPSSVVEIIDEDFDTVRRAYAREIEQAKSALLDAGQKAAFLACNP
jgi:hypothetical protein